MSTARQIVANQRNAKHSTGPKTPEGKAKSRANALKHGLAGDTLVIDALQADFEERKAEWQDSIKPTTPEGYFALEAVVAGTISRRISQCGQFLPQFLRSQFEELPEAQVGHFQPQQAVRRLILSAAGPEPAQIPVQTLQIQ